MKRKIATAVLALFGMTLPLGTALAHGIRLEVNGRAVETAAHLQDGQLLVRTRSLAEAMNAVVEWDPASKRVTLVRNGSQTAMWIGSTTAFHNGIRYQAPTHAVLKNGSSYVPAWFIAQKLGGDVYFDGRTMRVTSSGRQPAPPAPAPRPNPGTAPKWVREHPLGRGDLVFPFPAGAAYDRKYFDNYGDGRFWNPNGGGYRKHEGVDINAPKGTPLVAIGDGKVVRYGWNQYGGWRLMIELDGAPGFKAYYAHLNGYAKGIYQGARVRKGQVIGYVGRTGYGPEGHEGDFPSHLHFGIYVGNETINPFPFLKLWESRLK